MKIALMVLLSLICLTAAAQVPAPTPKTVELTWDDLYNNPATTTYCVYRTIGIGSNLPAFTRLAAGLTVKRYDDVGVQAGPYSYVVTAVAGDIESGNSNVATAKVPPNNPSALSAVIK
jgi:hypothetical protein